ncbi:hypothetical protein BC831DRAFT_515918 [Entophlyctis helioformis]|nr:hypothetical protein BC831DRAFT_515918 [Entophlyctis helioformis]
MADVDQKPKSVATPAASDGSDASDHAAREHGTYGSFFSQLSIMLRKNTLLQYRYLGSTVAQALIAPLVFSLLLFLLQRADYATQSQAQTSVQRNLPAVPLQGVARCQPCVTIMYATIPAPIDEAANATNATVPAPASSVNFTKILETFSIINEQRTGYRLKLEQPLAEYKYKERPSRIYDILPVPSTQFIYNSTLEFPNTTAWAITFNEPTPDAPLNIQYQIWFNDLNIAKGRDLYGPSLVGFMRGMDEAIISVLNDPNATVKANIDINIKDWPELPPAVITDRVFQTLGPAFFFCSEMMIFISALSQIVSEKELRLRHAMQVMGLRPAAYWLSHLISYSVLVLINALSMAGWGIVFGFPAIKNTNFLISAITFFLFGEAMVVFAFFMTPFIRRTNSAVLMGIFVFIVGLLFQSFVFTDAQSGYSWWSDGYKEIGYVNLFALIPFFNFGRMILDMSLTASGRLDKLTGINFDGGVFTWSSLTSAMPANLVPSFGQDKPLALPLPIQAWYLLIMNCFLYGLLLWYFDNVIPDEFGACNPPYFFLTPTYWGLEKAALVTDLRSWLDRIAGDSEPIEDDEDEDVVAARERAFDPNYFPALKIVNLRKVYGKTSLFDTGERDKTAVRCSSFTIEEGKLFALLGQNGAGKSTTISMLSGLTPATSGDALIFNLSVKTQNQRIRSMMGICPQHDVLFDDLTAREHIQLYAGIKGIPAEQISALIEERLKIVRLHTVADVRAGTYSGGMKRRLSLVISTIGDPKIIFMDEPTTGMDPVNRRYVWSFIEEFKVGRVIVLTTHSMEEADVLGDEIGIMSNGRLRAINNSIALKTKFGVGFRVSVVTNVSTVATVMEDMARLMPQAKLEDASAGALLYQFPSSSTSAVPALVDWLEKNQGGLVKSWGISQSTLEEVFLKLVREANAKFTIIDEEEARERLKVYRGKTFGSKSRPDIKGHK